jgi:hypothetical protein
MSDPNNERFSQLLKTLALRDITPMELHSQRLGDMPTGEEELQLEWNQALADSDPLSPSPDMRIFRPKYEFSVKRSENVLFHQKSIFIVAFDVTNLPVFNELWADVTLQKIFREKQLQHTMWPIFRQHVLDGMSRLNMKAAPLPWLI